MKGTNHQTERGEMPLGGASAVEQSLAAIKVFPPGMKIEKITKPDIEVLDIGTLVQIGPKGEEIQGVINEISISNGGRILYRVSWWNGRERRNEYLEAYEVVSAKSPSVKIGFTR